MFVLLHSDMATAEYLKELPTKVMVMIPEPVTTATKSDISSEIVHRKIKVVNVAEEEDEQGEVEEQ